MTALVFVSTELAPFTPGGIGRVLHNMLRSMDDVDRSRSIVLLVDIKVNQSVFNAIFPGVRLKVLDTNKDQPRYAAGRRVPPVWAYSSTHLHWKSAAIMLALEALAQQTSIEYVEFPDWGGLGFCTLQERRFSSLLAGACIAVRLHSTHTVILNAEARKIVRQDLCVADMERKCLRDCDRVVAQLPSIGNGVRDQLAIPAIEWDHRLVIHAPPVLLDHHDPVWLSCIATPAQQLMFTSKIQRFKRPDLFIRGVSAFMRKNNWYAGQAAISAHTTHDEYDEQIRKLIPPDFRQRFQSMPALSPDEREEMISTSTVVVSSVYESFCLAAYEASLLGARLIINATNPAFDESSPWRDGVNCFKFDGTASGMVEAIERSFASPDPLEVVQLRNDAWPWQYKMPGSGDIVAQADPLVSIIVPHFNLGEHLAETLENILAIKHRNIEIVLVDDASTDAGSVELIDALKRADEPRLKVACLAGNVGLAAARNIGIRHASGDYVLTLDADDLIDATFVTRAVRALENNPEFDIVVTPAAYFVDGEKPPMDDPVDAVDYAVFTGEAGIAGLLENRYSTATAVFRKAVLQRFPYNEDLHCYEDWSLYMRMCDAGVRFIVTTDAFFFYRKRKNSMVHALRDPAMRQIEYSDLLRTSAPLSLRNGSRHLVLGLAAPSITHDSAPAAATTVSAVQVQELLRRLVQIEQILQGALRIPRFFWRRLLPFRRMVARAR